MLFRKATPESQTILKHCLATNLKTSPNYTVLFCQLQTDPSPLRIAVSPFWDTKGIWRTADTRSCHPRVGNLFVLPFLPVFNSNSSWHELKRWDHGRTTQRASWRVYRVPIDLQRLWWLYVEWMHESCQDLADTHKIHPFVFATPWPETWTAAIVATTRPPTTTSSWQPSYPSHYLHHDVNGSWLSSNSVCLGNTMDILLEKYTESMESSDIYR